MVFETASELLQLYSINEDQNGPADFCTLVELTALFEVFPQYHISFHHVLRAMLRQQRISPLVFWARMKRQCGPLLSVDLDTWAGLGVPFGARPANMSDIAQGVAAALAERQRARYIDHADAAASAAGGILVYGIGG